jgi:hypothetical protein
VNGHFDSARPWAKIDDFTGRSAMLLMNRLLRFKCLCPLTPPPSASACHGACRRGPSQRGILHERTHSQLAPDAHRLLRAHRLALQNHNGGKGVHDTPPPPPVVYDLRSRPFPPTATLSDPRCSCMALIQISASSKSRRATESMCVKLCPANASLTPHPRASYRL